MNFHEDFIEALRSLIIEQFEERVEAAGLEIEDFADRAIDSVDDSLEILCDTIIEFVDNELDN